MFDRIEVFFVAVYKYVIERLQIHAFRSADGELTVVWTGQRCVEANSDRFAVFASYYGIYYIALIEFRAFEFFVFQIVWIFLYIFVNARRFRGYAYKAHHSVAAVYV